MNNRIDFGIELKKRIRRKQSVEEIGRWAYSFYFNNTEQNDSDFDNLLLTLGAMEDGPEFAFSYEDLEKIADSLIISEDVKT